MSGPVRADIVRTVRADGPLIAYQPGDQVLDVVETWECDVTIAAGVVVLRPRPSGLGKPPVTEIAVVQAELADAMAKASACPQCNGPEAA